MIGGRGLGRVDATTRWGEGGRTEDGVDDMIGGLEGGGEVVDKGDFEILQLLGQALRTRFSNLAGTEGEDGSGGMEAESEKGPMPVVIYTATAGLGRSILGVWK